MKGKEEEDADPARSDDFETARISSRYDEYHSLASLCVCEIVRHIVTSYRFSFF